MDLDLVGYMYGLLDPEEHARTEAALSADPAFADCHYNAALLYEALGKPREAIRHMAQYRRLQKNT